MTSFPRRCRPGRNQSSLCPCLRRRYQRAGRWCRVSAPGVPTALVDATAAANKSFQAVFQSGGAPCAGLQPGAPICPLAVNLNTFSQRHVENTVLSSMEPGVGTRIGSAWVAARGLCGHSRRRRTIPGAIERLSTVCEACASPLSLTTNRWTSDSAASTSSAPVRAATIAAASQRNQAIRESDIARKLYVQPLP